jgi:hypothetical protein
MTMSRSKIRWTAVAVIALALSALAYSAVAYGRAPNREDAVPVSERPMSVEPDGGIGDTPIPVEPAG